MKREILFARLAALITLWAFAATGCLLSPEDLGWGSSSGPLPPGLLAISVTPVAGEIEAVTAGDLDGDGFDDLAILVTEAGGGQRIRLVYGHEGLWPERLEGETPGSVLLSMASSSAAERAVDVEALGDLDGDGAAELALIEGGAARVLYGQRAQIRGAIELSELTSTQLFVEEGERLRYARRSGDLDGDGVGELLVIGDRATSVWRQQDLAPGATLGAARRLGRLLNDTRPGCAQLSVESADLDGDGIYDLLQACDGGWEAGMPPISLFYGGGGFGGDLSMADAAATIAPRLPPSLELLSQRVTGAGDRFLLSTDEGYFALARREERLSGPLAFEGLITRVEFAAPEAESADSRYRPVALFGSDTDGDGRPEIVLSEYIPARFSQVRVVFDRGFSFAPPSISFDPYAAELAYGDLNGDGFDDLILSTEVDGEEEAHVLFGSPFGFGEC